MPKISVIVPVYNVEQYIHRCVDSILNQTFTDFELILIDDGSPDNCGRICDEYAKKDNRIRVIHQENGGLSAARNAGIDWAFQNSNSEWITFIDSDDWVHKQYLEILYDVATSNNSEVSCCGFLSVKGNVPDKSIVSYEIECGTAEKLLTSIKNYCIFNLSVAWGRLYKKHLFSTLRFPFGRYHEDEFTTYKALFESKNIAVARLAFYYYFQNESGIMRSKATAKKVIDHICCFIEQLDFYYANGSQVLFSKSLRSFKWCRSLYCGERSLKPIIKSADKTAKKKVKKYLDFAPEELKKYGYKKWITNEYKMLEEQKNDFCNVKKEKGYLFAIIWSIKQKIKKLIRM